MRGQRVSPTGGIEENGQLIAFPTRSDFKTVPRFVLQCAGIHIVTFGRAHPPALRQNNGDGLGREQLGFTEGSGLFALHQPGAPCVAELFRIGLDFILDKRFQAGS